MSYWSLIHLTKKALRINPSAYKKFGPKAEIEPYAKGTFFYLYICTRNRKIEWASLFSLKKGALDAPLVILVIVAIDYLTRRSVM